MSPHFHLHLTFFLRYISPSAQISVSLSFVQTFDDSHVHFTHNKYQTTSPFHGLSPSGPRRTCSHLHHLPEESSSGTASYFTADDVYLSGSFEHSRPTTAPPFSSDSTPTSTRPLVGLLVKINGEEIPFLIPRPSLPFRLPEAKP